MQPLYIKSELRTPQQRAAVSDARFFEKHARRNFRIRRPVDGEYDKEFQSLGEHNLDRRRVIVKRVERVKVIMSGIKYMPIPFLLFGDETVEDRDDILALIFDGVMKNAAEEYRMKKVN